MRNNKISGTKLLKLLEADLVRMLPESWRSSLRTKKRSSSETVDAVLTLRVPGQKTVTIAVEVKRTLAPKEVARILDRPRKQSSYPLLVAAPFLSPRTRELLTGAGTSYFDATGNLRIVLEQPALFLSTQGAQNNPWREDRPLRSLKGPSAARVIRALCDFRPPYGVRELAGKAGVSYATVSRVASFLENEAVLTREGRGRIEGVEWRELIRRWSQDYVFDTSNTVRTYLNPRTQASLTKRLRKMKAGYAITGGLAVNRVTPIAAVPLVTIYVENMPAAAEKLGLKEAEAGANVLLAEPMDPVVFERTWTRGELVHAAMSQVAADLMTGPGRGPSEAEAFMQWMGENEDAWRS